MVTADPAALGTPSHPWQPRVRASLVHLGLSVELLQIVALAYVPMIDRQFFWTVLVDRSSAEVVGFLPLDAF